MAKITLLEIVQGILSDADGDNVNSINDTVESTQCALLVRDVYRQIIDVHDLEAVKTVVQLTATSSSTPNVMNRPEGFHSFEWVKYDKKLTAGGDQNYEHVHYMPVESFLTMVQSRTVSDSNVTAVTLSTGIIIPVINDQAPTYYTIMDEGSDELVFDSYDSNLETNLQQSKSMAYGVKRTDLSLADSTTLNLPRHLETLVQTQARAMYFDLFKDGVTSEVDRSRRRAEVRAQRLRRMVKNTDNDNRPDYGRK